MLKSACKFNCNNGSYAFQSLSSFLYGSRHSRHILFSSTATKQAEEEQQPSSLRDFLVKTLGFSQQQSLSTSTKLAQIWRNRRGEKKVSDFNFAENADSVAVYFKQIGFENSNLRKIISFDPRLLCANVDKTLKPKIKILQDLGFSGSDLVHVITSNPIVLDINLCSAIEALRAVLGSDDSVITVLKRHRWSTFSRAGVDMKLNVELMASYGVPRDKIHQRILQQPGPFLRKAESFRDILSRVEEKLGISRSSGRFLYGFYLLAGNSEKCIESKCRILESFGWEKSDVVSLMRRCPLSFTGSAVRLQKSLSFLMNELGYKPAFLVSHPAFLSYSLEKRLVPRHTVLQVLKEKGLFQSDTSLYSVARMTEPVFLQKCVHRFKDVLPDLHRLYANSKELHPALQTKQKGIP